MYQNGMIMRQPATRWQDALPCGNGEIGALVYGNIADELVLLNHEDLWMRTAKPEIPDVSRYLPQCRSLLAAGHYKQAEEFLSDKLLEAGYQYPGIDPYHPAFDLHLQCSPDGAFRNYRRAIQFDSGEVTVSWQDDNANWSRQLFISRTDNVLVMRISATSPGQINYLLELQAHDLQQATGMGSGLDVAAARPEIDFYNDAENGWLTMRAEYHHGGEFGGLARVITHGGEVHTEASATQISNADDCLIIMKLFANEAAAEALPRLRAEIAALPADYATLLSSHSRVHGELYTRQSFSLAAADSVIASNEELLQESYDGVAPASLMELVFHYGRYLLISSSRPGGLPANLQGLWNGDYSPAWSADFHNDENIQMNYWQALPGNMPEVTLPYFDYYEALLDDYRANARAIYGCRGILTPVAQSTNGMIFPGLWVNWCAGAGWLAQLFFDYWLFTGDRQFLSDRAVPFMKEAALFYEDFLTLDEKGYLFFSPSLSPENEPLLSGGNQPSLVTVNATMDVAIARELLSNLCQACELLAIEEEGVARWRDMLAKLPPYQINSDGALCEWLHDDLHDNYHHRHLSHIYPLFPGFELTEESDDQLFHAARVAVEKRFQIGLQSQTGWSFAHMANIYARLGDGDRALTCLQLITRACMGANLLTYHNDWRAQGLSMYWGANSRPPFQIDANFGVTAAIQEMLCFSQPGLIKILPALPADWQQGEITGVRCRGNVELSIAWDMTQQQITISLFADTTQTLTIKFPQEINSLHAISGNAEIKASPRGAAYRQITLPARQSQKLRACW